MGGAKANALPSCDASKATIIIKLFTTQRLFIFLL
jgi:hypothetical protein